MRFPNAPAWSGRMMSHSCFGGGGLGGAAVVVVVLLMGILRTRCSALVVRGILRMRGSAILEALVVESVKGGRWRKGKERWRREGSIGGCGLGGEVGSGFWDDGKWYGGDSRYFRF